VLTDFPSYHAWNPFITKIQGELTVGNTLTVSMSPPDMGETTLKPTLLVYDAPRELRWRGHLWFKGLFDAEHFFQVQERDGRTRFVHGEDFNGVLVRFANRQLTQVARGFVYMNQALKKHLEAGPSATPPDSL
jgi:hypothetical protein